jgi:hypothetical protein
MSFTLHVAPDSLIPARGIYRQLPEPLRKESDDTIEPLAQRAASVFFLDSAPRWGNSMLPVRGSNGAI